MHDKRVCSNLWLFRTLRAKYVVVKLFDICCHVRLLYRESEQVFLLPDVFCQCQIQKEDCFSELFPCRFLYDCGVISRVCHPKHFQYMNACIFIESFSLKCLNLRHNCSMKGIVACTSHSASLLLPYEERISLYTKWTVRIKYLHIRLT